MNFLAHIYLSGPDREVQLGNFIGDFVKGNQVARFPTPLQIGIMLHRFIDSYTDSHEVVRESKLRLRSSFRHYSPVIVDVFYDHFLARDWERHHPVELKDFTERFYQAAKQASELLPTRAVNMLHYMSADNWLYHYQFKEGIRSALTGMSRRTPYNSGMERAHLHLEKYYEAFASEFDVFFPQLVRASEEHLKELRNRFSL